MIPIDVIEIIGDMCDPYTALHVLSLNKTIHTAFHCKRSRIKQKCRFLNASMILKEHVSELRDRVYGFSVNGITVIEYTICKEIMVHHQKIIKDSTRIEDCITVIPMGYGIVKAPHDEYVAFVSYKSGAQINSFGLWRPINYLRPCLSPNMMDKIVECMCTIFVPLRKLSRT